MTDFSARWKTTDATIKANEIIAALKANKDIREFFDQPLLYDKYSEEDKYFNDLLDLRGINFIQEDFSNCSFSHLNVSYCKFVGCNFSKVNFFNSRIHESTFDACSFSETMLDAVYGHRTAFKKSTFERASFGSCFLVDSIFYGSNIANSNFSSARLVAPTFKDSTMISCDFSWARMTPTKSLVQLLKKNKSLLNLNEIEWLNRDGQNIKSPLNDSLWEIKNMIKEILPFK